MVPEVLITVDHRRAPPEVLGRSAMASQAMSTSPERANRRPEEETSWPRHLPLVLRLRLRHKSRGPLAPRRTPRSSKNHPRNPNSADTMVWTSAATGEVARKKKNSGLWPDTANKAHWAQRPPLLERESTCRCCMMTHNNALQAVTPPTRFAKLLWFS